MGQRCLQLARSSVGRGSGDGVWRCWKKVGVDGGECGRGRKKIKPCKMKQEFWAPPHKQGGVRKTANPPRVWALVGRQKRTTTEKTMQTQIIDLISNQMNEEIRVTNTNLILLYHVCRTQDPQRNPTRQWLTRNIGNALIQDLMQINATIIQCTTVYRAIGQYNIKIQFTHVKEITQMEPVGVNPGITSRKPGLVCIKFLLWHF